MTKRKILLLVAFTILMLLCVVLWPSIETVVTGFPEILLGQVALARETKPPSAEAYQSAEFVLKQVAFSEIEQAFYIPLHDDVLFWDPWYAGFPRTELNEGEIRTTQQYLTTGRLFYQNPDGNSYQCVTRTSVQEPRLETCAEGEQYMNQYVAYQWDATQNHTVGVLQFFLMDGQLAEIRVYSSEDGIAYTPYEMSGGWWLDGVANSSPMLEELSSRATLQPIATLWPELTADQANARAAQIIGKRYLLAVQIIQDSPTVGEIFGPLQEIRPAIGKNLSSSWMDSNSVFLTFRVLGTRGEGAVIIEGNECFHLQIVFQGIPIDGGASEVCP